MQGWQATTTGRYAEAIALYNACIKDGALSKTSLARTWRNLGITWRRAGQPLKAVAAYDKAIALSPDDVVDDYINRANAWDEADEFDKALADYSRALALKPGFGEIYYNRGITYEHNHKLEQAKADFIAAYDHGLRTRLLYERFEVYGMTARWQ